ncbi:MAG: Pr6Pr family membrane protein [Spirochaetaceae bacterium]|nr:Pr6Pr family membrane protein [Spirochaetaceae bacterium]
MFKDRRFILWFRIFAFLLAIAGILYTVGFFSNNIQLGMFLYYTMITNTMAAVLWAIFIKRTVQSLHRDGRSGPAGYYPRLNMIFAVPVVMMGIAYWVIMAPASNDNLLTFVNLTTHGTTPLLFLIDYLLFSTPGKVKRKDIGYAVLIPVAYVVLTYSVTALGFLYPRLGGGAGRYPYFFFNVEELGLAVVTLYIAFIAIFTLLLGCLFYFIDKKRADINQNTSIKEKV